MACGCSREEGRGCSKALACWLAAGASLAIPVRYLSTGVMAAFCFRGMHELFASTPSLFYQVAKTRTWKEVALGMVTAGGALAAGDALNDAVAKIEFLRGFPLMFGIFAGLTAAMLVTYGRPPARPYIPLPNQDTTPPAVVLSTPLAPEGESQREAVSSSV